MKIEINVEDEYIDTGLTYMGFKICLARNRPMRKPGSYDVKLFKKYMKRAFPDLEIEDEPKSVSKEFVHPTCSKCGGFLDPAKYPICICHCRNRIKNNYKRFEP